MRGLIALAFVLVLAACSAAGGTVSTGRAEFSGSKVSEAVDWSEDELVDYLTELTEDRLKEVCAGKRTIGAQRECLREALYLGFDSDGLARERCDAIQDMEQFGRCIIIGTFVHDTFIRAGMPEATDFDWTADDAELEELGREVGAFLAEACLDGDPAAIDRCLLDSLARTFGGSPASLAPCYRIERTDDAGSCILRVSFAERFERAARLMGKAGEVSV